VCWKGLYVEETTSGKSVAQLATILFPSFKMFMLLNLPQALISSVLSTWLTIVDVARLDSAYCSSHHRSEFLEAAYEFGTALQYPPAMNVLNNCCNAMSLWILSKGAPVSGLFVTSNFSLQNGTSYLQHHGRHIQWVDHEGNWRPRADCSQHTTALAQYCSRLMRLNASTCLDEEGLMRIIQHCPLLEELTVASSCTSQVVMELSRTYSRLKRLSLHARRLSEECLIALVRSNPGLLSFSTNADGATGAFVFELAKRCSGLEELSLSTMTVNHAPLHCLLRNCPNMTSLRLSDILYVPPEEEFALTKFTSMRKFVVHVCEQTSRDVSQLGELVRACPNLTSLSLCYWPTLLDEAILPLSAHFSSLQNFFLGDFCGCRVRDEVLLDISKHYPQLITLEIPCSFDVTDIGLVAVAAHCPLLQLVDVTCCLAVTDDTLFALAQNCRALLRLLMIGCDRVTDDGVTAVIKGCPDLVDLEVDNSVELTDELRNEVKTRRRYVQR
jgi:hypothetical protein